MPTVPVPSGSTEQIVAAGRDTVNQVVPPLPRVVQQPVDDTLDTVQGVARTVDGVTGPLLP
jgi:hypothetical protein